MRKPYFILNLLKFNLRWCQTSAKWELGLASIVYFPLKLVQGKHMIYQIHVYHLQCPKVWAIVKEKTHAKTFSKLWKNMSFQLWSPSKHISENMEYMQHLFFFQEKQIHMHNPSLKLNYFLTGKTECLKWRERFC